MLTRIAVLCMIAIVPLTTLAQSADDYFKQGTAAFKQSHYKSAVVYFKKAGQAGMSSPVLDHNLGSSYYKLKQYELAKKSFLQVAKHKQFRQIAHYNLGLVARRLKNYRQALHWFKKAIQEQHSQQAITDLAANMIKKVNREIGSGSATQISANTNPNKNTIKTNESASENSLMPINDGGLYSGIKDSINNNNSSQLRVNSYTDSNSYASTTTEEASRGTVSEADDLETPRKEPTKKGKMQGGLQIAAGVDGNVDIIVDEGASGIEDQYLQMFGYVRVPLSAKWKALGNFYSANYSDSDEDLTVITAGIQYTHKLYGWSIMPNINFTSSTLKSEDYQNIVDFKLTGQKKLGSGKRLKAHYRYSDISAENPLYLYEAGSKNQLRVEYHTRLLWGKLRLRYDYETNDRDDAGEIKNASPTRHTFRARLKHNFTRNWSASGELQWRTSEYEPDAFIVDEQVSPRLREDDRLRVKLDLKRAITKKWSMGLLYVYTDNDSNLNNAEEHGDDYSYEKNDIQIYSFWRF